MSYLLDPAYKAIQHLRSEDTGVTIADAWERWTGSRPKNVHTESVWTAYRPRHKAREVLHVKIVTDSGELHEMDILFCAFMDKESYEAQKKSDSTVRTPSDVLPPMENPDRRALAWVLPYVPKPKDLPDLMDPEWLASIMPEPSHKVQTLDLVRYVPMRRGLVRFKANDQEYYAKTFARPEQYISSIKALRIVADLSIKVPELVAVEPKKKTMVMNSLNGVPLSQYLINGSLQPFFETGIALASIHQVDPLSAQIRMPDAELADIEQLLIAELTFAMPELAKRCTALVGELRNELKTFEEMAPGLIHGKLFGDQILYDSAATHPVAFVDWDDLTCGDPHFDLGRLIAHMLFDAEQQQSRDLNIRIKALLDGYQRGGGVLTFSRLKWFVAASLLLRGKISLLRYLAPDWDTRLERVVAQAESVLIKGIDIPEKPLSEVT